MPNGHFERAMEQANERLGRDGYDNAPLHDIMLVGFQYLAQKQDKPIRLRVDGKGLISIAILVGGIVGGMIQAIL